MHIRQHSNPITPIGKSGAAAPGSVIHICGVSFSGTTMTDLMLGSAPNAFSCGEVYAWFRPWRRHHSQLRCGCGQVPCPVWQDLQDVPEETFHQHVAQRLGAAFIVDSSKRLDWVLDSNRWALDGGFQVFNFLVWKNPIELAYSLWMRGQEELLGMKRILDYGTRLLDSGLQFQTILLSEMRGAPVEMLSSIGEAVGMRVVEGQERFWEPTHHHLFGNSGVTRQVVEGTSCIRQPILFPEPFQSRVPRLLEIFHSNRRLQDVTDQITSRRVRLGQMA